MGQSKLVDARSFKRLGIGATRDMARPRAGIHAADELDIVGRDQLSAAEYGIAAAPDAAAER
jgi:hypothetical protein